MKLINKFFLSLMFGRKTILGLALGFALAIIVLNIDKKLWLPIELETIKGRNNSVFTSINKPDTSNIILILFDDKTKFLLRRNGLPIKDFEKSGRELITQAIKELELAGVQSIGINLNLSNPGDGNDDNLLSKVISSYQNIVLANSIYSTGGVQQNKILGKAKNVGYGELYADYDNVVHDIKLVDNNFNKTPSFAYEIFKVAQDKRDLKSLKITNNIYLKYPRSRIKMYSFIDLIQGKISKEALNGKIVFLGLGLKSKILKDALYDPFGNNVSDSEVQAVAVSNLLNDSYLFKVSFSKLPYLFVLVSMILGAFFTNVPVVRGLIIGSVLITTLMIFGQVAYSYMRLAIEIVPSFLMMLGTMIMGSLIYLQLNLQEQNVELETALFMLNERTKELENSKLEIEGKNVTLSDTLSQLNNKIVELGTMRKQVSYKREEERKRIARELHDDTLARITDLKLHIESIIYSKELSVGDKKKLGACVPILDNVTHEVRRTINALRPSMLDNALGLLSAIENLLDELEKRTNYSIKTKFTTSLLELKFNESDEIQVYRIIQEALNNVYKHAHATEVEIVIEEQFGQLLILVIDNGVGINAKRVNRGYGMLDMKERAELIGGKTQYLNKPNNSGTTLELTIPICVDDNVYLKKKEMQTGFNG